MPEFPPKSPHGVGFSEAAIECWPILWFVDANPHEEDGEYVVDFRECGIGGPVPQNHEPHAKDGFAYGNLGKTSKIYSLFWKKVFVSETVEVLTEETCCEFVGKLVDHIDDEEGEKSVSNEDQTRRRKCDPQFFQSV